MMLESIDDHKTYEIHVIIQGSTTIRGHKLNLLGKIKRQLGFR